MARANSVLLDLDGTVWDSWPWYAQVLHAHGAGELEEHAALMRGGKPAATLLRSAGVGARQLREACAAGPPPLYPGMRKALRVLDAAGARLAAVTSLPKWMSEPLVETHGDSLPFATVVSWGDTTRHKPRPDPLERALEHLGLNGEPEHWYLGDTNGDAVAAKAAGLSFAWAAWGYSPERPELTDRQVDQPADIPALL